MVEDVWRFTKLAKTQLKDERTYLKQAFLKKLADSLAIAAWVDWYDVCKKETTFRNIGFTVWIGFFGLFRLYIYCCIKRFFHTKSHKQFQPIRIFDCAFKLSANKRTARTFTRAVQCHAWYYKDNKLVFNLKVNAEPYIFTILVLPELRDFRITG